MRKALVRVNNKKAGFLEELGEGKYQFIYDANYKDMPVSLTMPYRHEPYIFNQFPAFFEGLLPEGEQLEALLRKYKLDRNDYFAQLLQVGKDMVGAVTIEEDL